MPTGDSGRPAAGRHAERWTACAVGGRSYAAEDVNPLRAEVDVRPPEALADIADNEWHYVPDELAQTIALAPAGNGEPGQDWVLIYTPEKRDTDDREKVLVRLTPRALHELYIEVKGLDVETRQIGHRAECALCGELVDVDRAIPNDQGEPCHRSCWADAYGAPEWFVESG